MLSLPRAGQALAACALLALVSVSQVNAFGRGLLQQCKKSGSRCSLYQTGECCADLRCTMPLECSTRGDRKDCFPECRKQVLSSLKNTTYPSGSGQTPALEGGTKTKHAVIVMQEWWGINDAIKSTALHIADQGYRVLIPDLYRGKVALVQQEALGLQRDLNWTRGVDDIVNAVKYLKSTGSQRVGIIGFCQGGAMAFCGAELAGVDAAIAFYGIPGNTTGCNPLKISNKVPIQAHFGLNDTSYPPSRVEPFIDSLVAAGKNVKLFEYPGFPHAFFNALTPEGRVLFRGANATRPLPDEALLTLAFQRVTFFLRKYLKKA